MGKEGSEGGEIQQRCFNSSSGSLRSLFKSLFLEGFFPFPILIGASNALLQSRPGLQEAGALAPHYLFKA